MSRFRHSHSISSVRTLLFVIQTIALDLNAIKLRSNIQCCLYCEKVAVLPQSDLLSSLPGHLLLAVNCSPRAEQGWVMSVMGSLKLDSQISLRLLTA